MKPISTDLAYRLRYERGLYLQEDREYENERIKEIAIKQNKLIKEFNELDVLLKEIYMNEQDLNI